MSEYNYNNFHQNNQYKLILTNKAQKRIQTLMSKYTDVIGLRIDIKKSGCAGFTYVFKKVINQEHNETDIIFEYTDSVKLFISNKIISFINGSTLDYTQDGLNYMFKFTNPNVHNLCGCGESFNIKK